MDPIALLTREQVDRVVDALAKVLAAGARAGAA